MASPPLHKSLAARGADPRLDKEATKASDLSAVVDGPGFVERLRVALDGSEGGSRGGSGDSLGLSQGGDEVVQRRQLCGRLP